MMHTSLHTGAIVLGLLQANVIWCQGAFAASAQSSAQTRTADAPDTLGEVIVTAQKRAQNLQDVPISLEVVSEQELHDRGIGDLAGLAERIPNFQFNQTTLTPQVYIRGFGSAAANLGFEQSVSLYVDGIYNGRSTQFNAPLYDLQRVEVLRGPQGALLGKNTDAGAINVITANPGSALEAGTDALYNFDRQGLDLFGFASGPLTEKLAARVAVKYSDLGGYIRNIGTGTRDPRVHNVSGRLTMSLAPADGIEITGKFQLDRLRSAGSALVAASPTTTDVQPVVDSAPPFGQAIGSEQNGDNGVLAANFQVGGQTLTSVTGYSHYAFFRATPGGFVTPEPFLALFDEHFHQVSQELRLTSPAGQFLEYIAGLYYDTSAWKLTNISRYNVFNALIGAVQGDFGQDGRTYSGYAQATLNLTSALRMQAGLRYTKNRKSADYRLFSLSGAPIAAPRVIPRQSIDESKADPSFTVQYDLTPGVMAYATFAEGSKGGGFASQTRTVTPSTFAFGQEKSTNYEIGVKSTFLERRLEVNLSAFKTEVEDMQVSTFVPAQNTFVDQNAARASSTGVEGSFALVPVSALRLSASVAYDRAIYDDFPGAACPVGAPTGCTSATNNLAGYELSGASKWSGTVEAALSHPITERLRAGATAGVEFRSGYFTSTDYSPVYGWQEGYAKVNGRLELGDAGDHWTLALIGRNLTNRVTSGFSYLYPLVAPSVAPHAIDETRTVSLQMSVRF